MNNFTLEVWDDEARKCTFYTVRWEGAAQTETDKFFDKYDANPVLKRSAQVLLSFVLDSIGEDHGAVDGLFNRFENEVVGLPNKGRVSLAGVVFLFPIFPLRLYALRIRGRSDLVVLFNGGVKSAQTNQTSKDLNMKWMEACQFARRIDKAFMGNEIIINAKSRTILSADGSDEIFL